MTTVVFSDTKQAVVFSAASLTPAQFAALIDSYFSSLVEYDSNEDAVADGLASGQRYIAGMGHNTAPHGAILTVV